MSMNYGDIAQSTDARAWADSIANEAYYNALARGQDQSAALNTAKFEWQKKMDEATQTGQWNGQFNMPSQQFFANTFGTWNPGGPQSGDQTLAANQQGFNQAYQNSQLYGQYVAPGGAPAAGASTLQAQNQANQLGLSQAGLTGYYVAPGQTGQGTQTLAGQNQQWNQGFSEQQEANRVQQSQQQNAQSYLQLLSSLRGPADWAKYQQVLGSTPGGMRDLVAAAAGQYVPGGGATTGFAPQPVSLQSMLGDVNGQGYGGNGAPLTMPGQQPQPYAQAQYGAPDAARGTNSYAGGAQQQYGQMQAAPGAPGGGYVPPQGYAQASYGAPQRPQTAAWGSGIGIGPQQATPAQQQQATGGGANTMGQMPAPNQIAAQSWKNLAPSQQQMMLGGYEAQGWDKNDVTALMNQSLPKYASGGQAAGSYRLQ